MSRHAACDGVVYVAYPSFGFCFYFEMRGGITHKCVDKKMSRVHDQIRWVRPDGHASFTRVDESMLVVRSKSAQWMIEQHREQRYMYYISEDRSLVIVWVRFEHEKTGTSHFWCRLPIAGPLSPRSTISWSQQFSEKSIVSTTDNGWHNGCRVSDILGHFLPDPTSLLPQGELQLEGRGYRLEAAWTHIMDINGASISNNRLMVGDSGLIIDGSDFSSSEPSHIHVITRVLARWYARGGASTDRLELMDLIHADGRRVMDVPPSGQSVIVRVGSNLHRIQQSATSDQNTTNLRIVDSASDGDSSYAPLFRPRGRKWVQVDHVMVRGVHFSTDSAEAVVVDESATHLEGWRVHITSSIHVHMPLPARTVRIEVDDDVDDVGGVVLPPDENVPEGWRMLLINATTPPGGPCQIYQAGSGGDPPTPLYTLPPLGHIEAVFYRPNEWFVL